MCNIRHNKAESKVQSFESLMSQMDACCGPIRRSIRDVFWTSYRSVTAHTYRQQLESEFHCLKGNDRDREAITVTICLRRCSTRGGRGHARADSGPQTGYALRVVRGGLPDGLHLLCHRHHGPEGGPHGWRDHRAAVACPRRGTYPQRGVHGVPFLPPPPFTLQPCYQLT